MKAFGAWFLGLSAPVQWALVGVAAVVLVAVAIGVAELLARFDPATRVSPKPAIPHPLRLAEGGGVQRYREPLPVIPPPRPRARLLATMRRRIGRR